MPEIDTYYGEGRYKNLKSRIFQLGRTIYVELYDNEIMVDMIEITEHNIHYAESIAENFCNGVPSYEFWNKIEENADAADRKDDLVQLGSEGGVCA